MEPAAKLARAVLPGWPENASAALALPACRTGLPCLVLIPSTECILEPTSQLREMDEERERGREGKRKKGRGREEEVEEGGREGGRGEGGRGRRRGRGEGEEGG